MITKERVIHKLLSRVRPESFANLIYQNENQVYILFNKYSIRKQDGYCTVVRDSDQSARTFSSLKVATTWCILDRYNKIIEGHRVVELDSRISGITTQKINLNRLQTRAKLEQKEIYRDKLLEIIHQQKQFQYELDKYIRLAKSCQQRGFDHELTRTSS